MKKLLAGTAALAMLAVPQVASARMIDAGSGGTQAYAAASSDGVSPHAATTNLQARGNGTATSCGAGCTAVSGAFTSNQLSGTFAGQLHQVGASGGCTGVQGTLTLYSGSDSLLVGVTGSQCGARFFGDYTVTDGTGAYQEDGVGYGAIAVTDGRAGAFQLSASGSFYPHIARQTGVDWGSPQ
jgi:hypothetical protein